MYTRLPIHIKTCILTLIVAFMSSALVSVLAQVQPEKENSTKKRIAEVLNIWHRAAAKADFNKYFSYMADGAVFMGTDGSEYWQKEEFKSFSKPYFRRGKAWNFTIVSRNIYLSENKHTAWFDEKLDTPNLGPARGSGVLVLEDKHWVITHYNLSIPIPNTIVDSVVKQIANELDIPK